MFYKATHWKTYFSNISESEILVLVKRHASFTIQAKNSINLMELSSMLDRVIESAGFKTRVYTGVDKKKKIARTCLGSPLPGQPHPPLSLPLSWLGIGIIIATEVVAHYLTREPDYEIRHNTAIDTLDVVYMRKN
jgi:hypothetical protein